MRVSPRGTGKMFFLAPPLLWTWAVVLLFLSPSEVRQFPLTTSEGANNWVVPLIARAAEAPRWHPNNERKESKQDGKRGKRRAVPDYERNPHWHLLRNVFANKPEEVERALQYGAQVDLQGFDVDATPLMEAAERGFVEVSCRNAVHHPNHTTS